MSTHLQNVLRARRGVPISKMQQLETEVDRLRRRADLGDSVVLGTVIAVFILWLGGWI